MADYPLIEKYLSSFRRVARSRRDIDDLTAEVADHLEASADAGVAAGLSPSDAEAAAVGRFGDPRAVAIAMATRRTGVALPTSVTHLAGLFALSTAVCFLAAALCYLPGLLKVGNSLTYNGGHLLEAAGFVLIPAVLLGMLIRSGAGRSWLAVVVPLTALVAGLVQLDFLTAWTRNGLVITGYLGPVGGWLQRSSVWLLVAAIGTAAVIYFRRGVGRPGWPLIVLVLATLAGDWPEWLVRWIFTLPAAAVYVGVLTLLPKALFAAALIAIGYRLRREENALRALPSLPA